MVQTGQGPSRGGTRERIIAAGEQLFARHGIHRVRLREIYDLAGQRNSSALHYHFGSRDGLVEAIMRSHQAHVDAAVGPRLDHLESSGAALSVRDVLEAVIPPMADQLATESGRNFLRIVPQLLETLSVSLRAGRLEPSTRQSRRVIAMLSSLLPEMPEPLRRERVVTYVVVLTGMLAERAHHLESGLPRLIGHDEFAWHLIAVIEAILTAPAPGAAAHPSAGHYRFTGATAAASG